MIRIILPVVFLLSLFMWTPVLAAEATFFGPIVPGECNCDASGMVSAPDWGCVMQTVQNAINFTISMSVIIATIFIIYTGFMFVASAGNPHTREAAKTRLVNVVVGMLVVLAAWLIVDFIMKALYNPGTEVAGKSFGPWNAILDGEPGVPRCFEIRDAPPPLPGVTAVPGRWTADTGGPGTVPDGEFTYDAGISAQRAHVSAALGTLLTCMAERLPGDAGRISSISDSRIVDGERTFQQCAANGCSHTQSSCHYGGRSCVGRSYAVDFGDEENVNAITRAAQACGASRVINEGDHIHVSVGGANRCGCD